MTKQQVKANERARKLAQRRRESWSERQQWLDLTQADREPFNPDVCGYPGESNEDILKRAKKLQFDFDKIPF
nr:MAG TPA: hypothetical protein [Caudoviricetes sp.]